MDRAILSSGFFASGPTISKVISYLLAFFPASGEDSLAVRRYCMVFFTGSGETEIWNITADECHGNKE